MTAVLYFFAPPPSGLLPDSLLHSLGPVVHLGLGLDVLPQQPLLIQGVAGFAGDGVDGTLIYLLFDGTEQQKERLAHRLLERNRSSRGLLAAVS